MTLNVTVLTRTRIYQSSDFRLTAGELIISNAAMKLVTLHYPSFNGFVSYTGLAQEQIGAPQNTADRIIEWLQGKPNLAFHEVVEILRLGASAYISDIEKRTGIRHRLTLIVAAFVQAKPTVAVISNFESTEGRGSTKTGVDMIVSWGALRAGANPRVIITGCKPAVAAKERTRLEQLIDDAGEDSARIRVAIEELNRDASRSPKWGNGISENCTVVSLDSSGAGLQDFARGTAVKTYSILNGVYLDMEAVLSDLGMQSSSIVGAAFGSSKQSNRRSYACDRVTVDFGASSFEIVEIAYAFNADCHPYGINNSGTVIGASSRPDNRAWYQYWTWNPEFGMSNLDYWSQSCSAAINESGSVAVSCRNIEGEATLLVIEEGGERLLNLPDHMMEPEITTINSAGVVGGAASINRDVTDGNRTRPAIWDPSGSLLILDQLCGGENGRVVALNDSGVALVWANRGLWGRLPLVWDINTNTVKSLPAGIIPLYITNAGHVIGIGQAPGGQVPVISYNQETWEAVPVRGGFAPNVANNNLLIAGRVEIDGYYVPWTLLTDSTPTMLSTYQYHNASLNAVNDNGVLVGQASTDHEQHVLLWRPPK
ncbi:hypothetical protein [Nonomuraea turcica]|uniref:hypothetical protein n=1 Tax=Nonomuraea sp. G32 TaxID=3067274 RepID=UPI00273B77E9|nr:hypothetical protein [Nonomuraea sp. G32]MDP4507021.1 hypothetical protein [Nonomuraea sp. G32]